ncbi:prolipoprotein diacylglyceryl transferase [Paenarthrobacter ilicis]|uniref:Phosphatidylglycerol--prolipoprotein diacylglyceryl transferase n=1 Tax=Paenarthrobacter ilicis TaxID=43665 RepID=A0ABX0TKE5_9MICC|nr:prolipoprotein diacylglyceryl transferase [Paenarthrobacter ilicis]MBM7793028.1 prolipoprotein diacylglyceryl transferase [Paenarthrobacter ilicis]NIJ03037.1 prolipoprotein diacylglyceryl transferase [Paenarthrobacter ilicis]
MQNVLHAAAMVPLSIPSPSWSGFDIPLPWGTLRIHAYALCILAGIIIGLWLTSSRWKRRGAPEGSLWDIAIWAIPFGIIGGRLYHVFSSPDAYFGPGFDGTGDLSLIPQIQRGGLGIWGAVVLGAVGAWIGCRRAGLKLTAFLDAAAPGLLLAQAIGRLGNWFNQELFGAPTTLPWGLEIDPANANFPPDMAAGTLFHPTFLYEMLWNLLGVAILLILDRKFNFRRGRLFWLYAMYYTVGRVWIEALRIDDAEQISLFGITTRLNVWTSIFVFVAALIIFVVLGRMGRPVPDSPYLPGKEPQEEGAKEPVAVTSVTSHDVDASVSDSGVRGNLPDNQSDPGHIKKPQDAAAATAKDPGSAAESTATATAAEKNPGSSPKVDDTK